MVYIKTVKTKTKSGACATHLAAPRFKINAVSKKILNAPTIHNKKSLLEHFTNFVSPFSHQ